MEHSGRIERRADGLRSRRRSEHCGSDDLEALRAIAGAARMRTLQVSRSRSVDDRRQLVPLGRSEVDVTARAQVGDDPQLDIVIKEIVHSFDPHMSLEVLLHNVLGGSDSASVLIKYLVNHYASSCVRDHIRDSMKYMIRWAVLEGFVPCKYVLWTDVCMDKTGPGFVALQLPMLFSGTANP